MSVDSAAQKATETSGPSHDTGLGNAERANSPENAAPGPETPTHRYTPALADSIERNWQKYWADAKTFEVDTPAVSAVEKVNKQVILDMFPYPSGAGLHVGHPLGYIATDVFARYQRATGHLVLHTLGFDSFGLPAEQYAVQTGQHPRLTTEKNISAMSAQLRRLGLGHDQRRAVSTTDSDYVRWTQWMFLQMWNSWFDPDAAAARPISELATKFELGTRALPSGLTWESLTLAEQRDVLDEFRLAYISETPVNWCPGLGTVLSNEEVTNDGRSERGNYPVFPRNLRQWNLRISAYADRLIEDLDGLDWPEPVKQMQRHWIGRSFGAYLAFQVTDSAASVEVFTTRPDTLFGATFLVLAVDHPLTKTEVPTQWPEHTPERWRGGYASPAEAIAQYQAQAASQKANGDLGDRGKTGVFTGCYAINPVNGERLPIFIADYVLLSYGTGAIMAVPGQDQRDWDFATEFELKILRTIATPPSWSGEAFSDSGLVINSANNELSLNGLSIAEAKSAMVAWLVAKKIGRAATTYRLRDWLFSRQRYWGEPFPIVFDDEGRAHAVPEKLLPVNLPEVPNYEPRTFDPDDAGSDPEPPLGRLPEWVATELDLGEGLKTYRREVNTMPNWAGSCWYYLRYLDPKNATEFCAPEVEKFWLGPDAQTPADPGGVDLYVGGKEHAVLHLLYARFWHKVLFDLGHVTSSEPFRRYFGQGMIQAYAYRDQRGQIVPAEEVAEHEPGVFSWQGSQVTRELSKMGKSLKNVVTPDEIYASHGADTFRVYEMSMGPLDVSRPWETRSVVGSLRFLQRLWRNVIDEKTGLCQVSDDEPDLPTLRFMHRTISTVSQDYQNLRFNTAIAKIIEFNNFLTPQKHVSREVAEVLVQLIAPVAPHIAEELWRRLGHEETIVFVPFPQAEAEYLVADLVTCVVQIQGKVRERIEVVPDISADELLAKVLANARVQEALAGREVRKVIVRAPNLVSLVAG